MAKPVKSALKFETPEQEMLYEFVLLKLKTNIPIIKKGYTCSTGIENVLPEEFSMEEDPVNKFNMAVLEVLNKISIDYEQFAYEYSKSLFCKLGLVDGTPIELS